jgi:hypothetical protein
MSGETDWISLGKWVESLRDLHQKARLGQLPPDELKRYHEERDTLSKAILAAQRLRAAPGARGRQSLRVAKELRVELIIEGARSETRTVDLGAGGFAILLSAPPRVGQLVEFFLELDHGKAVGGRARVLSLQLKGRSFRVAFRFEALTTDDKERIELAVFEFALAGMTPKEK